MKRAAHSQERALRVEKAKQCPLGMRVCMKCRLPQNLSEFPPRKDRPGKTFGQCRRCQAKIRTKWRQDHREEKREYNRAWAAANPETARRSSLNWYYRNQGYRLKKVYGISVDDWNAFFIKQEGACAICREVSTARRLSVDHDHSTGKVRGLLCSACNTAIGLLKESEDILKSATDYLKSRV